ncbi:MAG TPA: NADPH-dependent FMN reductase [Acidimicrobiales bacterium]|nr:NADPH-dependent FMN reductase [Acidimicrobiales bacterium]
MTARRVLLIAGSLRTRSSSAAVLRTARSVAPPSITCVVYGGLARLPHFNPDDDGDRPPPGVAALRDEIHWADAVMFSTPEYAGALPGSFKNLLDWTIGDDQPRSISEKPVAWINPSPRGAVRAHDSLRTVLGYANATVVEDACLTVPVTGDMIGDVGVIADRSVRRQIRAALVHLADPTGAAGTSPP